MGKRKVHHHIHRLLVSMLLLLGMSVEKDGFSLQGKGTLKILALLDAVWLGLQTDVLHYRASVLDAQQRALSSVGPIAILMTYP